MFRCRKAGTTFESRFPEGLSEDQQCTLVIRVLSAAEVEEVASIEFDRALSRSEKIRHKAAIYLAGWSGVGDENGDEIKFELAADGKLAHSIVEQLGAQVVYFLGHADRAQSITPPVVKN